VCIKASARLVFLLTELAQVSLSLTKTKQSWFEYRIKNSIENNTFHEKRFSFKLYHHRLNGDFSINNYKLKHA
jgi:hypothetical protein